MHIGIEVDRSVHMCYFTISVHNIFNDDYTNFCLILRVLCELFFLNRLSTTCIYTLLFRCACFGMGYKWE